MSISHEEAPAVALPITPQRLVDTIASRIKDFIVDRKLTEGDRLPTEQQFAEMFGVSRLSVREATRSLAFLGILRSAPRRGLTIGKVDMGRVSTFLGFHLAASNYPRNELVKARMVIESGALAEAVERIAGDEATFQRLCTLNDRLRETTEADAFVADDLAFHQALLACSQVGPLIAFSGLLEVFFRSFKEDMIGVRATWANGIDQHRDILLALRQRDLPRARTLLENHLAHYVVK